MDASAPNNLNEAAPVSLPTPPPVLDQTERLLAALGYFGFLCVLPLLMKPTSSFCQFHGKQSLGLCLVYFFLPFVAALLPFSILHFLLYSAYFAAALFAAYQAYRGLFYQVPVLYDLTKDWKF